MFEQGENLAQLPYRVVSSATLPALPDDASGATASAIESTPPAIADAQAAEPIVPTAQRQQLVVRILILLILAGVAYFYLLAPLIAQNGDADVVAIVGAEKIRQSDVDVQVSLRKAINEAAGITNTAIIPAQVLNQLVFQSRALADIRKVGQPDASNVEVDQYVARQPNRAFLYDKLDKALASYGLSRSIFSDSVRVKLTIDNYVSKVVVGSGVSADQRDLLINNWQTKLSGAAQAQVSYPNPLRSNTSSLPTVGRPAPEVAGSDLNSGQSLTLSELKGRPVMINFWATWCAPCRQEMPEIVKAYAKYKDTKKLIVIALSIEGPNGKNDVARFMQEYKMTFPVLLDDANSKYSLNYRISSLPSTYFIDANGVIKWAALGAMSPDSLEAGLARILP